MKKIVLLFLSVGFLFTLRTVAQITPLGSLNLAYTRVVPFQNAGDKIENIDNVANTITLYNLNLSVFKTINIVDPGFDYSIFYVSEDLFDTDPSDFEYMMFYTDNSSGSVSYVKIFEESGALLFSKANVTMNQPGGFNNFPLNFVPIYNTDQGTIMILKRATSNSSIPPKSYYYALPGTLYCPPCSNGSGFTVNEGNSNRIGGDENFNLLSSPNPAITYTKVYYNLPENISSGELIFFNTLGEEVKRFKVDELFSYIQISTDDLPSGTYSYRIHTENGDSEGKQLVVIQ